MQSQKEIEEIYFKQPLYRKLIFNNSNAQLLVDFFHYQDKVEGFNPKLNENTTFKVRFTKPFKNNGVSSDPAAYYPGMFMFELICLRNEFTLTYFFQIIKEEKNTNIEYSLVKIGQSPSLADLEFSRLDNYVRLIEKKWLRELKKAIGLAANGIGIGSFVYIRRVFENLIELKRKELITSSLWDEVKYQGSKMDEKILLLRDNLPSILVSNRKIYSIVSKGIHELSEQECLEYFPVMQDAIILILEEDYRKKQESERLIEMEANINKIHQNLKK